MNEIVTLETSKGNIDIELNRAKAPETVENFLEYVKSGHYNETIFHRVIADFMIQGGGFTSNGNQKKTNAPIILESSNGLKNETGTIAMARTNIPDSATCQFFINVVNNSMLNYSPGNPGYAVFGKIIFGMDVVNKIKLVPTMTKNGMKDWPREDIVIKRAYLK